MGVTKSEAFKTLEAKLAKWKVWAKREAARSDYWQAQAVALGWGKAATWPVRKALALKQGPDDAGK